MTTFPISLSVDWSPASQVSDLSNSEHDWLFESHSLTAKLKSHSQSFSVKVLSEQVFDLSIQQQKLLNCTLTSALNREVLLLCDDKPMVYAQSWLPDNLLLKQSKNPLHNMGERPLGDVIFQDPELVRKNIEIARFNSIHPLQQLVSQLNLPKQTLLGRRSVFSLQTYNFLVCEVFLPGAYLYS
ncbi:chorismate lyase [Pseudoalteromonas sp. SG45-5]|uniref:chorismate--pyruvate lyase family protein n=1 Tax=unclassified Pseudoalteromonas TaxID=194690 RepID=UPI0015F981D1|nr:MULTISPECIES: chorismate lyase [unclassified Pseudoalteromonas]MBB1384522.1 chorismate lyase [Pseudoalteromonas sp. SG45-5]MBB1393238.1 chorismate lyase [Pseudoalteromonas sp. SG44-4]MBB1447113.1 chorismate lyase [Pseudoalteromonas sp. SG41-6]